jgi:nitroimidazol reductase NimA-like FMN-containing flavoprotein (pyridoxamine 5'-phosphate oxidase superfamily)
MAEPASERTRVRRVPQRGAYDRATVEEILDAALICHVGIVDDAGAPVVLPMLHARVGDELYLHGASSSRLVGALGGGAPVCVTVTLLDGLVLARSAFHHSLNYRSAVVFGQARAVEPEEERLRALEAFVERLVPERWGDARPPNRRELKATRILAVPLHEASAKIRTGPPADDEEDYELPVWAGVIPLETVAGEPEPDPRMAGETPVPPYVAEWASRRA